VYAFFMHCYHLKDWIKNDASVKSRMPNLGTDLEQFINESEALSLCADLCNFLKRLKLDRSHSSEPRVFGRKRYHYQLNIGSRSSIKLQWLVQRNSKPPIDAFELTTECIAEWDKFLTLDLSPQWPSFAQSATPRRKSFHVLAMPAASIAATHGKFK